MQQGSTDFGRASELVDVLLGSSLPFREQLLGGGPWQVVYSRGPLLWQGFTAAGNALSKRRLGRSANKVVEQASRESFAGYAAVMHVKCCEAMHACEHVPPQHPLNISVKKGSCAFPQASQDYKPADRTVINRGEVLGSRVYVTASGTYEPEVPSAI